MFLNICPYKTSNWARHRALDTIFVCVIKNNSLLSSFQVPQDFAVGIPPRPQLSRGIGRWHLIGTKKAQVTWPKCLRLHNGDYISSKGLFCSVMSPPPTTHVSSPSAPASYWVGRVCKHEDRQSQAVVPGASAGASSPVRSSAASPASPSCGLPSGSGACSACMLWSWEPSPGSCPAACRPPPPASAAGGKQLERLPEQWPDPWPSPSLVSPEWGRRGILQVSHSQLAFLVNKGTKSCQIYVAWLFKMV